MAEQGLVCACHRNPISESVEGAGIAKLRCAPVRHIPCGGVATAVLTSNTSYLDVNEIAESVPKRTGYVLGTHFFSPANVMRLLEVVRTDTVDETVLMSVLNLGRKMGKLPIVSGVCHGFIGNRMLEGYFGEAAIMVEEGAEPEHIDRVMCEFEIGRAHV